MGKHEALAVENTLELLQGGAPGPQRLKNRRRHKRRRSLAMRLTFLGADHDAFNWSVGGFLVKDTHPQTPVGTTTEGFLTFVGSPGRFAVQIELVRRDKLARETAWRFIDPSQGLVNTLARLAE
jgi:hypothetical protein